MSVTEKTLNWDGHEVRTPEGDLYSINQLSGIVWTTYKNGTAFPGWRSSADDAKAVAQENYNALTAALPFLTGVKVKALEWNQYGERSFKAETAIGRYVITVAAVQCYRLDDPEENTEFHDTLEAAKAAAQADYAARILSAIEVSELEPSVCQTCKGRGIIGGMYRVGDGDVDGWEEPCPECGPSPRAQALDIEAIKRTLADLIGHAKWADVNFGISYAHLREAEAIFLALSSQPVADSWLPIETAPKDGTPVLCADRRPIPYVAEWNASIKSWVGDDGYCWTPTHWRPLPASPGASE